MYIEMIDVPNLSIKLINAPKNFGQELYDNVEFIGNLVNFVEWCDVHTNENPIKILYRERGTHISIEATWSIV